MNIGNNINNDISDALLVNYVELSNERSSNVKHYITSKIERITKDYLWDNVSNDILIVVEMAIIRK